MEETCADLIVRNVPLQLLNDFDILIVEKFFPGGRSEAIRDLIRKAIQEQKKKAEEA